MTDEVTFTGQSGKTWRYWTGKPLGTPGSFGGVYAAEAADGSPMAVKVVKKQRPQGALDERLLRREIEIGKRVAESGSDMLLPVIDAADAGDALLLVMSQAEGGALADASFPLAEAEAMPVLVDIATGLQDLHSIARSRRRPSPGGTIRRDRRRQRHRHRDDQAGASHDARRGSRPAGDRPGPEPAPQPRDHGARPGHPDPARLVRHRLRPDPRRSPPAPGAGA